MAPWKLQQAEDRESAAQRAEAAPASAAAAAAAAATAAADAATSALSHLRGAEEIERVASDESRCGWCRLEFGEDLPLAPVSRSSSDYRRRWQLCVTCVPVVGLVEHLQRQSMGAEAPAWVREQVGLINVALSVEAADQARGDKRRRPLRPGCGRGPSLSPS